MHVVEAHLRVLGGEGLHQLDGGHLAADVGAHAGEGGEQDASRGEVQEGDLPARAAARALPVGQDDGLRHGQGARDGGSC